MAEHTSRLATILREHESRILADWIGLLATATRSGTLDKAETEENARAFVRLLADTMRTDASGEIDGPAWAKVREMLASLSASRARTGSSPSATASFIFSFKQPLFTRLREEYRSDAEGLGRDVWIAT